MREGEKERGKKREKARFEGERGTKGDAWKCRWEESKEVCALVCVRVWDFLHVCVRECVCVCVCVGVCV